MTMTINRAEEADPYDTIVGEPIAYCKIDPPYGHSPLPTRHAPAPALQAGPTIQVIQVPAPHAGMRVKEVYEAGGESG